MIHRAPQKARAEAPHRTPGRHIQFALSGFQFSGLAPRLSRPRAHLPVPVTCHRESSLLMLTRTPAEVVIA